MPAGVDPPTLGTISSTMGEIMEISMTSKETPAMGLRSIADWIVRPRLLGVPGVLQAMIIGGETKQFQILVDPARLADNNLTLEQVVESVSASNANVAGGFLERTYEEFLIPGRARVYLPDDIANPVNTVCDNVPILIKNIAEARIAPAIKRVEGSFNRLPPVIATIQKQLNAYTLEVTEAIETTLADFKATLPPDVTIDTKAFQQADFINRAVGSVRAALIEGAIMVTIVFSFFCGISAPRLFL